MYDNRLVISSPGGMFDGTLIQNRNIDEVPSSRRNPVLADVFAQLDYMEKRGSGLRKICNESAKLPGYTDRLEPKFKSEATVFFTEIINVNGNEAGDVELNKLENKLENKLSEKEIQIIRNIRDNPYITQKRLSEIIEITPQNIRVYISRLKKKLVIIYT